MKLEEKNFVTRHYTSPDVIDGPRLSEGKLEDIMDNLASNGINVDPDGSLMKVTYWVRRGSDVKSKTVEIPLGSDIPNVVSFDSYTLAIEDLDTTQNYYGAELRLAPYAHYTQKPQPGVIGGTFAGEFGVVGTLSFEVPHLDDRCNHFVERVRNAIYKAHDLLSTPSKTL